MPLAFSIATALPFFSSLIVLGALVYRGTRSLDDGTRGACDRERQLGFLLRDRGMVFGE